METLDYKPEQGKWAAFTAWHVLQFAIMRQLVDWGVPVIQAAQLAKDIIADSVAGNSTALDTEDFSVKEGLKSARTITDLGVRHTHDYVMIFRVDGEYLYKFDFYKERPRVGLLGKRSESPDHSSFGEAHLVLDLGYILYSIWERLRSTESSEASNG